MVLALSKGFLFYFWREILFFSFMAQHFQTWTQVFGCCMYVLRFMSKIISLLICQRCYKVEVEVEEALNRKHHTVVLVRVMTLVSDRSSDLFICKRHRLNFVKFKQIGGRIEQAFTSLPALIDTLQCN